eukprot:1195313-Prorocentrum_minimum.AAC.5
MFHRNRLEDCIYLQALTVLANSPARGGHAKTATVSNKNEKTDYNRCQTPLSVSLRFCLLCCRAQPTGGHIAVQSAAAEGDPGGGQGGPEQDRRRSEGVQPPGRAALPLQRHAPGGKAPLTP